MDTQTLLVTGTTNLSCTCVLVLALELALVLELMLTLLQVVKALNQDNPVLKCSFCIIGGWESHC